MHRDILLLMICFAMHDPFVLAEPVYFIEDWEGHSAGGPPGNPWYADPHMSAGSLSVIAGEDYNVTPGGNQGFLVNYAGFNGKDAGNQSKLVPDGQWVEATNLSKLNVSYMAKSSYAQQAEWYFEISLGDVHAPRLADVGLYNPLPNPIPVIAFCKPMLEPGVGTKMCYLFDGLQWRGCTFLNSNYAWGEFDMSVRTSTINIGLSSLPRSYLGGFDRISIYSLDYISSGYTVIDNMWISGGVIMHPLTIEPEDGLTIAGEIGGPFTPQCKTYTLTNIISLPQVWEVTKTENWLCVTPCCGTLTAGDSVEVDVCINGMADSLPLGGYEDRITFTNLTDNDIQTRDVQLFVGSIDTFTELFAANNDLDHQSLMLTPDGSVDYYAACATSATAFPADPFEGVALVLSGYEFTQVTLAAGAQVHLYGNAYSDFYVGANGYITFGRGDIDATESLDDHFALPRISGLFTDLHPDSGSVTWKQLMDRAVVTWQVVTEGGEPGTNSFQIEMFFDGRIRMTWLDLAATDGLVGLSRGNGTPGDYRSSDISGYDACPVDHHPADYDADGDVDLVDFGHLQVCLTGANVYEVNVSCGDADLDQDADVDQWDLQKLLGCMSGAEIPVTVGCED